MMYVTINLLISVNMYGTWFSHTKAWWRLSKTHRNIHVVFYEDLKKNPALEISKLAKFLQVECQQSPEFISKVAEVTSFAKMKENAMKSEKTSERSKFMWKTGKWMVMRKGDALCLKFNFKRINETCEIDLDREIDVESRRIDVALSQLSNIK